jgi:hypothetical protein
MAKDRQIRDRDRRSEVIFVGACAAIFLLLAACAVYAVVIFAV